MMRFRDSFFQGVIRVLPLALGVLPFGMVFGVSSIDAGMSVFETVSMSLIIFAGTSQLVVAQMISNGVSFWVILLTGVLINLRMLMYSASLSEHLGEESLLKKFGIAYLMTDQAFATSIQAYDQIRDSKNKAMFYFGAGLLMWTTFVLATFLGAICGKTIPVSWELDFAVPLTFLALLVTTIKNQWLLGAAIVGGLFALMLHALPYNLGLLFGGLGGVLIFGYVENRLKHERD